MSSSSALPSLPNSDNATMLRLSALVTLEMFRTQLFSHTCSLCCCSSGIAKVFVPYRHAGVTQVLLTLSFSLFEIRRSAITPSTALHTFAPACSLRRTSLSIFASPHTAHPRYTRLSPESVSSPPALCPALPYGGLCAALPFLYTRKAPKTIANTASHTLLFIWMKQLNAGEKGALTSSWLGASTHRTVTTRMTTVWVCVCVCARVRAHVCACVLLLFLLFLLFIFLLSSSSTFFLSSLFSLSLLPPLHLYISQSPWTYPSLCMQLPLFPLFLSILSFPLLLITCLPLLFHFFVEFSDLCQHLVRLSRLHRHLQESRRA